MGRHERTSMQAHAMYYLYAPLHGSQPVVILSPLLRTLLTPLLGPVSLPLLPPHRCLLFGN